MIRWAVSRPAVVWAASVIIVLGGAVSFTRLALATRTEVELPRLNVNVSWPGASAELVEMYIASPIEATIQSVRGVKKTRSDSNEGSASLVIDLEPGADVQIARLTILERLELLRPEFPPGVSRPQVRNYVPEALATAPLLRLMLDGPYTPGALRKLVLDLFEPRITAVSGVAGVAPYGGTDPSVSVSYDPSFLRQLGVSPAALAEALTTARQIKALGLEKQGASEREVSVRDQPGAVEDLERLPVRGPAGRVFRMGELATIRPEEDARGMFYRIDGQPAIALVVSRLPGADAIKTSAAVRAALREIEPKLPPRVRVTIRADESEDLGTELKDLLLRGAMAFTAVILVVGFMLRDIRAVGLVMGSAAVAIAGTALGLYLFKIPANMLTLAGLAMGIGILVQNGLVVTERLGTVPDTPSSRALMASRITPAVIGATLTTAVVLFPFLYLQGNARAAFVPFAAAFVMALGWSVLSSVVMIPALARGHRIHEASWPRARRFYARLVAPLIRWRWITLTATTLMLVGLTWVFVKKIPRFSFSGFGFGQRTTLSAFITFPRGSDPQSLDQAVRELERIAVGRPGVEMVEAQSRGTSAAGLTVTFSKASEFSAIPLEMEELMTQRAVLIGGASVSVRGQGPGFSSGFGSVGMATFRIRVLGYSFSGVEQLSLDLKERLERIPRVRDVDNSTTSSFFGRDRAFAVTISPDRPALARYGLTARDLNAAVSREIYGAAAQQRLEIGGEEVPVSVKAEGALDRSLDDLRDAVIPTPTGAPVRIGSVSLVSEQQALSAISREDQQYMRIVAYEFRGPNKLAQRTHDAFMKSVATPAGYRVEDAGFGFGFEPDNSERGLWLVFAIGIALVILSVALVFDSTWAAGMVFASLPVALGGVIAIFWIAKAAFTREAAVGVILVVGHAVNQAILLVDSALARRRANALRGVPGLGKRQVLRASLDRAGMIVLVTMSTLASLLPLAIGTSASSLFGAIALAAAGGMLAGTLGAMFVVPAMLVGRGPRKVRGQKPAAGGEPVSPLQPVTSSP
jgi:HAE1 family hydrophobic/amphiphilic exporter-1